MILKAIFNWFELPSWEYIGEDGNRWRATMITPFDIMKTRIEDIDMDNKNELIDEMKVMALAHEMSHEQFCDGSYWRDEFKEAKKRAMVLLGDAAACKEADNSGRTEMALSPASPILLFKQVKRALRSLVHLKDYKEKYGKDDIYKKEQPLAWAAAKAVMHAVDHLDMAPATLAVDAPEDKSIMQQALENSAQILANFKGEGDRTKVEEWQACYAMLFKQMNVLVNGGLPQRSLEVCAIAGSQWLNGKDMGKPAWPELCESHKQAYRDQAAAMLRAIEVPYV